MSMARMLLILLITFTAMSLFTYVMMPKSLDEISEKDTSLYIAIQAAETQLDPRPLQLWLAEQDLLIRQQTGRLILSQFEQYSPQIAYEKRMLLVPFTKVSIRERFIETNFANMLIYTLVTYQQEISQEDLELASQIGVKFEATVQEHYSTNFQFLDTLGCLQLRQGKFDDALKSFTTSKENTGKAFLDRFGDLFDQRIQAAKDKSPILPLEEDQFKVIEKDKSA